MKPGSGVNESRNVWTGAHAHPLVLPPPRGLRAEHTCCVAASYTAGYEASMPGRSAIVNLLFGVNVPLNPCEPDRYDLQAWSEAKQKV